MEILGLPADLFAGAYGAAPIAAMPDLSGFELTVGADDWAASSSADDWTLSHSGDNWNLQVSDN